MVINGCQEGKQTPKLEEVICPLCGDVIEVFIASSDGNAGLVREDAVCETCGYVVKEGTPFSELKKA